jgi:hypothetical protein
MEEHAHLPDTNQLSILAATILLAYALTPFVRIPEMNVVLRLPFASFTYSLNFANVVSILTAFLAAVGADWLIQSHPHRENTRTWPHLLLPALTAWTIGVPLGTLAVGLQWWGVFAMGGILLSLVFIAEYIVVDFSDSRHGPASIGLTALSFSLYLILAIAVRAAGLRLYLLLPVLGIPLALISWRTMVLRLGGRWSVSWTFGIIAVAGQVMIGFQYWPVSPLAYGLILTGLAYGLTSIANSFEENYAWPGLLLEPGLVMGLLWIVALLVGG